MNKIKFIILAAVLLASVDSYAEVGAYVPGVSSGGVMEGLFSGLPADGSQGSLYVVTDCTDATCATGTGTPGLQVTKEWDGSAWSNVASGSGIASVSEDATPSLGGNLDADDNAVDNVANMNVQSLNTSEFHVAQYASPVEAIAACASAGGGRVILPSGNVNSLKIVMPKDALNKAICSLEGVGSTSTISSVGASVITVTDADASGEAGLHITASGQIIRGFTVYLPNAAAGTRGILYQSNAVTEAGGGACVGTDECDPGEYGINNFVVEDVVAMGPAAGGPGIGMEFQFALKGRIDGGESLNWDQGVLYNAVDGLTGTFLPNAANVWSGTRVRANDEGFVLAGYSSACSSVTFNGLTIEGNHTGLVAKSGSDCFVNDYGTYYEQSLGTQATRASILWESVGGNYYGTGQWFSSSGVDANRDIVRTTDFDTYGADVVIGGRFGNGIDYAATADIQLINSRYLDSVDSGIVYGTGLAHATDCPTYGARGSVHTAGTTCYELDANTLYICDPDADGVCEDSGEWVQFGPIDIYLPLTGGTISGVISDNDDLILDLDENQGSDPTTSTFQIRNGSDSTVFSVTESGTMFMSDGSSHFDIFYPNTAGIYTYKWPDDAAANGEQLTWNTGGNLSWETAGGGSSIFSTQGLYKQTQDDLIIGGDGDGTAEATEVEILNGVVTADGFVARSTTNPITQYKDSDATAGDVNVQFSVDCTDVANTTEDCDIAFSQQEAGTLRQFMNADADDELEIGGGDQNRVVVTTDSTGDSELVLPGLSVGSGEIAAAAVTGSKLGYSQMESVTIEDPVDADNFMLFKAPQNITVTGVDCITVGGTSAVIDVQERTSAGATPATVDATITCDSDGAADDGAFSNGGIDANDWVSLDIGTVTGSVTQVSVTITYTVD